MNESEHNAFIREILVLCSEYDISSSLLWTEELEFAIICNDLFYWGCADCEEVTSTSIVKLREALDDVGSVEGPELYCARQRNMRPQEPMYELLSSKTHDYFNQCGPPR